MNYVDQQPGRSRLPAEVFLGKSQVKEQGKTLSYRNLLVRLPNETITGEEVLDNLKIWTAEKRQSQLRCR